MEEKKCAVCFKDTPVPYAMERERTVLCSKEHWEQWLTEQNLKKLRNEFPKFNQESGWGRK